MTCQETLSLFQSRSPLDCTSAERMALCNHYIKCLNCRVIMDRLFEKAKMNINALEIAESKKMGEALLRHDLSDPECTL